MWAGFAIVVFVIVTLLLLLQFLDNPYRPGVGSLKPLAMERASGIMFWKLDDDDRPAWVKLVASRHE